MSVSARELIIQIGAALGLGPGTSVKELQRAVALETGIGFSSLRESWKGQYTSKTTISKLEQRAADNAQQLASKFERLATDPTLDRRDMDALRDMARRYRSLDRGAGQPDEGE